MGQKSVWLGGKAKSLNEPQGAPIKPGLMWIMAGLAAHFHGVLSGRCHYHPLQSQTHGVESFFHLMNSSRSCPLESKDLKERVEQECEGKRKQIKIYSCSVPGRMSSTFLQGRAHRYLSQPCFASWGVWDRILGNRGNTF